jgi:hypothetical protein
VLRELDVSICLKILFMPFSTSGLEVLCICLLSASSPVAPNPSSYFAVCLQCAFLPFDTLMSGLAKIKDAYWIMYTIYTIQYLD